MNIDQPSTPESQRKEMIESLKSKLDRDDVESDLLNLFKDIDNSTRPQPYNFAIELEDPDLICGIDILELNEYEVDSNDHDYTSNGKALNIRLDNENNLLFQEEGDLTKNELGKRLKEYFVKKLQ